MFPLCSGIFPTSLGYLSYGREIPCEPNSDTPPPHCMSGLGVGWGGKSSCFVTDEGLGWPPPQTGCSEDQKIQSHSATQDSPADRGAF